MSPDLLPAEVIGTRAETLLTEHIRQTLGDLRAAKLAPEYYYGHLPLCVIDAVYSLNARYESTMATVQHWCDAQRPPWNRLHEGASSQRSGGGHGIGEFVALMSQYDADTLASAIFRNRQRTSPRSGILKAEAVRRFAGVLKGFGIDTFGDADDAERNTEAEKAIREIPGQGSGVSFRYFLMLAGSDDHVKPDKMLRRFVSEALGLKSLIHVNDVEPIVIGACNRLRQEFPNLTPRLLDYEIWRYQRAV